MFEPTGLSLEYIRSGKMRALAVTSATRAEVLPDIPTVGEFVPEYEASGWQGVGAPRNTPVGIINKLNEETNAALTDPKMKARIAELGGTVPTGSLADSHVHRRVYREMGQSDQVRWHQGGLIRAILSEYFRYSRFRANRTLEPIWPQDRV